MTNRYHLILFGQLIFCFKIDIPPKRPRAKRLKTVLGRVCKVNLGTVKGDRQPTNYSNQSIN